MSSQITIRNTKSIGHLFAKGIATVFFLFFLYARNGYAIVDVNPGKEKVPLGASFNVLEDTTNALTLERILIENDTLPWQQGSDNLPSFGVGESSYWFRTSIRNSLYEPLQRYLELANPNLNRVEVHYRIKGEAQFKTVLLGTDFPYETRLIDQPNFVIPIDFPAGATLDLYIKLQTTSVSMQLNASLWDPVTFGEQNQKDALLQGMYYGVVIIMMLYNFFIFLVTRERSYLFYCGFGIFVGLHVASINGYAFAYLWPHATEWQRISTIVCGNIATVFACLFVRHFLQMNRYYKQYDTTIKYLAVFAFVETLTIPIFSFKLESFVLGVTTAPIYIIFVLAGIKAWQKGDRVAIYFTLPWLIVCLVAITFVLSAFSIISPSFFGNYGVAISTSIELVFLSLALAERINQLREKAILASEQLKLQEYEAKNTQEKLLSVERKAKEELELKVIERTKELSRALNQLSDTHARLQLMSTQDSLTGLKNRRYFDSVLKEEWKRSYRNRSHLGLLVLDVDYFKNINDSHGHQVGDEVLVAIARIFTQQLHHASDTVARFGGEEFIVLLPQCNLLAAVALAERLRLAVHQLEFNAVSGSFRPTISIGVACIQPKQADGYSKFIAAADAALYEAKKSGRNRVCIYGELPPYGETTNA